MDIFIKEKDAAKNTTKFLNEQLTYLEENMDMICAEYYGKKLGMDLNFEIYFGSLAIYELSKVYDDIHGEILTGSHIVIKLFNKVMNSCLIKEESDFSLKESLKTEVKLSLITNVVLQMEKKPTYNMIELITKVEKAHQRACENIETYFGDRDIKYSEIKDVIDVFEVRVDTDGELVDFHTWGKGFSLNRENASQEILEFVAKERGRFKEELTALNELKVQIDKFKQKMIDGNLIDKRIVDNCIKPPHSTLPILIAENSVEEYERFLINLKVFHKFLLNMKKIDVVLPKKATVDIPNNKITYSSFTFDYNECNADKFSQQWANYQKIGGFIRAIKDQIEEKGLRTFITYKNNILKIEVSKKRVFTIGSSTPGIGLRGVEALNNWNRERASIVLSVNEGSIYRNTGEQVLTTEVIVFELIEKIRNADKEYFITLERAKQMLLSVLSPVEEKMMDTEKTVLLEGKENYYALLNKSYNNVVKIPKNLQSLDDIKALCIHPDAEVPMYDGFASIALSVKSGDEEYIMKNSNEFTLKPNLKEKVIRLMNAYKPNHGLRFSI
ncbi:hypothetical protein AAGG74_16900 [Bacillus mexicanus]|uniref:hypothetical protein n=1 Tax=Bacillus mexicanus TaxID=2834415 RepID=UPI003D235EC2